MIIKIDTKRLVEVLNLGEISLDNEGNYLIPLSNLMQALKLSEVSDNK